MASKRKSNTMPFALKQTDMVFEDDDNEIEDQHTDEQSLADESSKGSKSRVSGRAKKAKAIYDPSEYNGPVHKRKKEQMEALEKANKSQTKAGKSAEPPVKSMVKSPAKVQKVKIPIAVPSTPETSSDKKPTKNSPPQHQVTKNIYAKQPPTAKPEPVVLIIPFTKEPSKRIQARQQLKGVNSNGTSRFKPKKPRLDSTVSGGGRSSPSDEYEKASTVDLKTDHVPDVRKWSHEQVYQYFSNTLGFSTQDSRVFKDEEIDGEALMIMKRSDIVTTKFEKLKLGVALKMWSHIIQFQTGSTDPTQAWK
jgi:lethal(3)malignant brain tumor-like protein